MGVEINPEVFKKIMNSGGTSGEVIIDIEQHRGQHREHSEERSRYNHPTNRFGRQVDEVLAEVGKLLKEKNKTYGNSALNPVRVFSKADTAEQIKVRIDDKLSRLARSSEAFEDEDTVLDLLGYLVLLRVAEKGKL